MQLFAGALQYGFSMEAILGQVEAVMGHRTTDRLHQITAPTLVITGDADRLDPARATPTSSRKHIPGARLVKVPGGSHGFNFETPDVFNREVLDFLAGVAADGAMDVRDLRRQDRARHRRGERHRPRDGARPRRAPAPTSSSAT